MQAKKRIAVLGGGMGSLAAVYALMADPVNRRKYEVTVYQQGWRLGGKGASGVNPERHNRIEEHGLHVFLGFYHRALALMRRCYGDLGKATPDGPPLRRSADPLGTFEQAFRAHHQIRLYHNSDDGRGWRSYPVRFPENARPPGELDSSRQPDLNPRRALLSLARWLAGALGSVKRTLAGTGAADARALVDLDRAEALVLQMEKARPNDFEDLEEFDDFDDSDALGDSEDFERRTRSADRASSRSRDAVYAELTALEGRIDRQLRTTRGVPRRLQRKLEYYRSYIALGMVNLRGIWSDVLFAPEGFANIDQHDYIQWLKQHGAGRAALDSPLAFSLYELAFSKPGRGAGFAAGVVLKSTLRMLFDYQGAFLWKMQAGMGDVVFAPMYQVLKQWGVRFEFFHQVQALRLSPKKDSVAAIDLRIQARTSGNSGYEPLIDVNGLPCWPSRPNYEQLEQGDQHRQRCQEQGVSFELPEATESEAFGEPLSLQRGVDFDSVLLGLSVSSLGTARGGVCAGLFAASAKWRTMRERLRTTATQALQVWRTSPPADPSRAVVGGYAKPFQTSMDMSHLLLRESWPAPGPGSLAYFCGPLEVAVDVSANDPGAVSHRQRARDWLLRRGGRVLSRASGQQGGVDPDTLCDLYYRANTTGSERYVLSVPGSPRHRLPVRDAEFANLFLSGDWVQSDVNAGCIEACVAAGFAAAEAISGRPVVL